MAICVVSILGYQFIGLGEKNMSGHYPEFFDDRRTSCSRDFAVGLLLGRRRFDGHYRNPNPALDPGKSFELLLDLLDRSIFEELDDELIDIEAELEDAKDAFAAHQGTVKKSAKSAKSAKSKPASTALPQEAESLKQEIDDWKRKRLECESTIALARDYLRRIDDALADKVNPILRADAEATSKHGGDKHITFTSLELWIDKTFPKGFRQKLESGASPVIEDPYDPADDQCSVKGLMNRKGRESLYLTFGALMHLYVELAKEASILLDMLPKPQLNDGRVTDHKKSYPNAMAAEKCFGKKDGKLVQTELALLIESKAVTVGTNKIVDGQEKQMQIKRIQEALRTRKQKLGELDPISVET